MGSNISVPIIVDVEKTSWVKPHTLIYNTPLRQSQLPLLNNFKTGFQELKLSYQKKIHVRN